MKNSLMNTWMNEVDDMVQAFSPVLRSSLPLTETGWFSPVVDIYETEKEFCFQFDLPGMTEKEIKLSVVGQELSITGERLQDSQLGEKNRTEKKLAEKKEDQTQSKIQSKIHRTERSYGKFERTFYLPEEVDAEKIEAEFSEGVLEVRVPKAKVAAAHQIPIHSSEQTH